MDGRTIVVTISAMEMIREIGKQRTSGLELWALLRFPPSRTDQAAKVFIRIFFADRQRFSTLVFKHFPQLALLCISRLKVTAKHGLCRRFCCVDSCGGSLGLIWRRFERNTNRVHAVIGERLLAAKSALAAS
jgi:hypothetical protein